MKSSPYFLTRKKIDPVAVGSGFPLYARWVIGFFLLLACALVDHGQEL